MQGWDPAWPRSQEPSILVSENGRAEGARAEQRLQVCSAQAGADGTWWRATTGAASCSLSGCCGTTLIMITAPLRRVEGFQKTRAADGGPDLECSLSPSVERGYALLPSTRDKGPT